MWLGWEAAVSLFPLILLWGAAHAAGERFEGAFGAVCRATDRGLLTLLALAILINLFGPLVYASYCGLFPC